MKTSKKKITNDEKMLEIKMLKIKTLKIKMKFYATDEISKHDDLMKHENFSWFSKWCQCRYNKKFNFMICDLHLDERTTQMYVSINIASSDHVTHKDEHIKNLVISIFRNRTFMKTYLIWLLCMLAVKYEEFRVHRSWTNNTLSKN